jgi:transcriptional regulator with PAS, ATPase and Fis domain
MTSTYRGGNSRLLAKSFDELGRPLAILDWQGEILFANAALCEMVKVDATQLVGKRCSWGIAADESPHAAVLTALAPPASALEGHVLGRQLTAPIVYGSTATGQLFIPIRDATSTLAMIIVVLGDWEEIKSQLPQIRPSGPLHRRAADEILVRLRNQWTHLDNLLPLFGESPSIQLAMQRAQLAIQGDSNLLVTGPAYIGKCDVVRGVFAGRLKRLGLQKLAGQLFPLDCSALDAELLIGMLEVFSARLRSELPRGAQLLIFENLDRLAEDAVQRVLQWTTEHSSLCAVAATSSLSGAELMARTADWNRFASILSTVEIHLPPLSQRREDVGALIQQVLSSQCAKLGRALLVVSAEASDLLTAYSWPENLAEIQRSVADMIQHAVLSASIQTQHLPVGIRTFAGSAESRPLTVEPIKLDEVLLELERIIVARAIKLSPRNRARVARWLGISRPRLLRRLSQLGLSDSQDNGHDEEE